MANPDWVDQGRRPISTGTLRCKEAAKRMLQYDTKKATISRHCTAFLIVTIQKRLSVIRGINKEFNNGGVYLISLTGLVEFTLRGPCESSGHN